MRRVCLLLTALILAACGNPQEKQMRASVEHAQTELHRAQIEPLAGARLRNALQIGESPVDYLVSGTPDGAKYGPYRWMTAEQPFDVVVSGNWNDWKLEGYGKTLDAPLVTVHVVKE